jgi:uncharacterized protein
LFRIAAAFFALTVSLFSADWKALKPEGYVSDFAKVIDPASRVELDRFCASVKSSTGVELALVTLPSLDGEPIEDVANTIFRTWGIGEKQKKEGLLLLLSIGDRKSRLEVGYGLEPVIPDGYAGQVIREMRPALRDQHYGDAFILAAQTLGRKISEVKGVAIETPAPRPQQQRPDEGFPFPIILVVIAVIVLLGGIGGGGGRGRSGMGNMLTGMLLGQLLGGARHGGRGRGGFGGYDSGDSFGGFGGGSSGGGGASSNW